MKLCNYISCFFVMNVYHVSSISHVKFAFSLVYFIDKCHMQKLIKSSGWVEDPSPVAGAIQSLMVASSEAVLSFKATSKLIASSSCRFLHQKIDAKLLALLKVFLLGHLCWVLSFPFLLSEILLALVSLLHSSQNQGFGIWCLGQCSSFVMKDFEKWWYCCIWLASLWDNHNLVIDM